MRINHNIAAINTNRLLGSNNINSSKSLEKLSSGLAVNRAGDNAAGLAISEKMRGQIRGLDQSTRNAKDGIALIQTTEGALNETHSILQRMRELAVQSANDTNTDADRVEIQKEIQQLTKEITRISTDTEFNTKKLLDGSMSSSVKLSEDNRLALAGNGISSIDVAPGSVIESGSYSVKLKYRDAETAKYKDAVAGEASLYKGMAADGTAKDGLATGTYTGAVSRTLTWNTVTNTWDVTVQNGNNLVGYSAGGAGAEFFGLTLNAGTANLDRIELTPSTAGTLGEDGSMFEVVSRGVGVQQFYTGSEDVTLDYMAQGHAYTQPSTSPAGWYVRNEDGSHSAEGYYADNNAIMTAYGLKNVGTPGTGSYIQLKAEKEAVKGYSVAAVDSKAIDKYGFASDLVTSADKFTGALDETLVYHGGTGVPADKAGWYSKDDTQFLEKLAGNGERYKGVTFRSITTADLAGGNVPEVTLVAGHDELKEGINVTLINKETGEEVSNSSLKVSFISGFDMKNFNQDLDIEIDNSNAMTFHIGANSKQNTKLTVQEMSAEALGVNQIDLSTQTSADSAITAIDEAINTVSAQRAALGAMQNRLEHTISNLGTSSENLTAAESQIRDVDMAEEMSQFTKNNILVQAATSMLAQANQQPQNILSLLQ